MSVRVCMYARVSVNVNLGEGAPSLDLLYKSKGREQREQAPLHLQCVNLITPTQTPVLPVCIFKSVPLWLSIIWHCCYLTSVHVAERAKINPCAF